MKNKEYQKILQSYQTKFDKNSFDFGESLQEEKHKMFIGRRNFRKVFDLVKDEYFALEKVDLLDYQKLFKKDK